MCNGILPVLMSFCFPKDFVAIFAVSPDLAEFFSSDKTEKSDSWLYGLCLLLQFKICSEPTKNSEKQMKFMA